ncbi:hypothetical protein [uncultured Actinomyces sp.]|uniref:hypothetical protein n=1 Tax=uncultured Actinomyces sp. TaxID=249061 RepID=UPI0028D68CD0|nr:hypothetical protein [uncultured Actinomyces sp.]
MLRGSDGGSGKTPEGSGGAVGKQGGTVGNVAEQDESAAVGVPACQAPPRRLSRRLARCQT